MGDIREFKTKEDKLKDWFKEVMDSTPSSSTSALVIVMDEENSWSSYYNCDVKQLATFKSIIDELHFDKFLAKNIGRYIEYVE